MGNDEMKGTEREPELKGNEGNTKGNESGMEYSKTT